jgi:hypothetical protein
MKRLNSKGLSLVEMCFAILILSMVAQWAVLVELVLTKKTLAQQDRGFAQMKAQQIFNELQACANASPGLGAGVLDGYNDGTHYDLDLTIDKKASGPGDPLSGNRQGNGHWRFLRQVQISPVDGVPQARLAVVRIWRCESDGDPLVPGLLLTTALGLVVPGSQPIFTQTPQVYSVPIGH